MLASSHQICSIALAEGYFLSTNNICMATLAPGLALIVGTDIGALLPDIDQRNSKINQKLPIKIDGFFEHRGMTHSLIGWILFAWILHWLFCVFYNFNNYQQPYAHWWFCLWLGLVVGYFLHLVEDSFSQAGVRWLQPFSRYDKWAYAKHRTLLRSVHHYKKDSRGKKIPCRHWWGRGYKVGGDFEMILRTIALVYVLYITFRWLFTLMTH